MSFDANWARSAKWLKRALSLAGDTHNLDDVRRLIEAGDAQFWPGERSALVTYMLHNPRAPELVLWLGGGELTELRDLLVPMAEAWGEQRGAVRSLIIGRAGWARAFAKNGYRQIATVTAKELQ